MERYADASRLGPNEARAHWLARGVAEGRRFHPGPRVMKIVLMTRDEWPLLQSWVLYHAHVFGGENIYVLDGSIEQQEAVSFLAAAQCKLGVNVFRTSAGLNTLQGVIVELLQSLALSSDFFTKLDTDEFLGMAMLSRASGALDFEVGLPVRDYVDSLQVLNGTRFTPGYLVESIPPPACGSNPALRTNFTSIAASKRKKTLFVAQAFGSVDLGAHSGSVRRPFNSTGCQGTDLLLFHFHDDCYDKVVQNDRKAVLSHGYILANDTLDVARAKCEALLFKRGRNFYSWHKVLGYLNHLKDPAIHRRTFYHRYEKRLHVQYDGLAKLLTRLEQEFEDMPAGACKGS